jgi:acetylornithine/succinyldiaminopimelate/putrescine aminotransferase
MELTREAAGELAVYKRLPVEIAGGEGVRVRTADGRTLLDFYGGHATALLGYRHPGLLEALARQAHALFFQTNLVEVAVRRRATDRLVRFAPEGLSRVFLVNSGAEANENALRVACRATGRSRVVCLEGGWHGRTAAAAAVTYDAAAWYGFPRAPFLVTRVPHDDPQALATAVDDDTAAVILEPVQGQIGARALDPAVLCAAREATRRSGALLIADEIQCGMGRTGHPFAITASGVAPDLLTTAKGLAGGFPAGALFLTEELAATIRPGDLGTTFGGGPMAAALIVSVLDALEAPGFLEHVRRMGALLESTCRVGPVTAVQGRGLLRGLRTMRPAAEITRALLERGILAGGSGDPHVVRIMPPLIVEEDDILTLARALEEL